MLFLPAGTFHYWQAWVFLAVFALSTWIPTVYLMRTNPAALERRMRVGPTAETRPLQRILITVVFIAFPATFVVSALDHRFGWSTVPAPVSVIGDVLVAVGLGLAMLVIIQNGYAAANVTVEAGQQLVSTGLVRAGAPPDVHRKRGLDARHPAGARLVLGPVSPVIPGLLVLVLRIRDEEELLTHELSGYRDYTQQVHYRLLPYVW